MNEHKYIDLMKKVLEDLKINFLQDVPFEAFYSEDDDERVFGITKTWTVIAEKESFRNPQKTMALILIVDAENDMPIALRLKSGPNGVLRLSQDEEGNYFARKGD